MALVQKAALAAALPVPLVGRSSFLNAPPKHVLALISVSIYTGLVAGENPIIWMGTSLDDLRDFPKEASQDAGYQLEQVQFGSEPDDWKPMPQVGAGTREIRTRTKDNIYRVFYVASFGDDVYVLHSFNKKTEQTAKKDIDRGKAMYTKAKQLYEQKKREGG